MNMSKLVSHIKMQLGLYAIGMPFKDDITGEQIPTENIIRDVLNTATIPVFSQYKPWIREYTIRVKDLKVINRHSNVYLLPNNMALTPIMYISNVTDIGHRNMHDKYDHNVDFTSSMQNTAMANIYSMTLSQMRNEPTFEYLGENKIRLNGFGRHNNVIISVACCHEDNGESIPETCYDSVLQLGTLDMKIFMYNTLKLYNEIPTAFGNIKLKVEDHQGAEADRTALLEKWADSFHLDMGWENYM